MKYLIIILLTFNIFANNYKERILKRIVDRKEIDTRGSGYKVGDLIIYESYVLFSGHQVPLTHEEIDEIYRFATSENEKEYDRMIKTIMEDL